ncbi:MAG TPA: 3-deoxy-manno-octulosonate cytidylyltransferase, partial [Thermoanaerobaculia bacterium]|nr:3-deoxy-manno-octulosonate cytidylyltransferase [Thermoanaerobaculia bacterium]
GAWELTPSELASGSDRIAWAARSWEADGIINVQGDEPLIEPAMVERLARHLAERPEDPMLTLACPAEPEALADPNTVKVVVGLSGHALYFSRAGIPYPRQPGGATPLAHVGIYGYRRRTLLRLAALPPSPLERRESLEQLRALEHGIPIRVLLGDAAPPGVDTAADLARVEEILAGAADS